MRLGNILNSPRADVDELFSRFFNEGWTPEWTGSYNVPTDVFHAGDRLVIRMDLPEVNPDDVEVTVQENTLLINGTRRFPYDAEQVRWLRRGTFYGDFTQRVMLGKVWTSTRSAPGTTRACSSWRSPTPRRSSRRRSRSRRAAGRWR